MSRIVRVEVGRFDYELVGDFKFFKTPFRPTVLLCLTDDDGVQGWGQSVPVESWTYETVETVETTCATILRRLFSAQTRLILRTFTDAWTARSGRHSPSVSRFAKLLWTLRATTSGASKLVAACTRYWRGTTRQQVRLSWTIQSSTIANAESQLAYARSIGYESFNIKIGYPQTPQYDLELVRAVIEFAPGGFHWVDANTSYDLDTAIAMAPRLADLGLKGLESPLAPNLIRGYQALKRQRALPILMDEGIVSPVEVAEFIALKMFDGIAMKVARCGGLWNATRIATLLKENDLLLFASGLTDPDLSMAASAHFFGWAGLDTPAAINGPQYIAGRGTTDPAFRADKDILRIPTGPGLGVTLADDAMASVTVAAEL